MAKTRKPERFLLRVVKGSFEPLDEATKERLRAKGYRMGDILSATLRKARNPQFHRLVFAIGRMVAENIEDFSGMDAYHVIKRLMLESGIGVEYLQIKMPGIGLVEVREVRSISFDECEEGEFQEIARGLCRHIAAQYWSTLSPEQVREMAEIMVRE